MMVDQEQELARVSSELDDLRGNMGQIMDMLQVIKVKLYIPIVTIISEISGPTFELQPARNVPSTWPPFGLPPSYMPLFQETPGIMLSTQHAIPLPISTEAYLVVHTVAPLIVHAHVQPHFEDQQHVYYAPESCDE